MIDVYFPAGLVPVRAHRALAESLTRAVLSAEGAPTDGVFAANTAAFLHELPADSVHTLADDRAAAVRVDIVTPPGVLNRERQRQLVRQATDAVADAAGDPAVAGRTWVVLRESAEGGWGIAGTAFGREEFASLRR